MSAFVFRFNFLLFGFAILSLAAGTAFYAADLPQYARVAFASGTAVVLLVLVGIIIKSLMRGAVGLDLVAAFSMAGSLALGETLAGNVIALMFSGGQVLEDFAQSRARREMTALLSRTPRDARRYHDGALEDVAVDMIKPLDRLFIRPGDILPVDGLVLSKAALIDESVMTGEAEAVLRHRGDVVVSGSTNVGGAVDLEATTDASGSTYAAIVKLVEQAEHAKAPMARLADRYAVLFFIVTLGLAGGAWLFTHDPLRALAVLVVATPCPLILAVPVAIVSGMSRAAKRGVLVKNGGALEALAATRTLLFDKTGTLTAGRPTIRHIDHHPDWSPDALLRLAGALSQGSRHVVSMALCDAARAQEGETVLPNPETVEEVPGEGIVGQVEGREVQVGSMDYVSGRASPSVWSVEAGRRAAEEAGLCTAIAVDGDLVGLVRFHDEVRPEAEEVLGKLRAAGIDRIALVTGDRREVAEAVAANLPIDSIDAAVTPQGKVDAVNREKALATVAMVGDGVNDAPALAAASVGIALGARGAGASSEAADIVLLVDRLDPLPDAVRIAKRSFAIARQSVRAGIGLSVLGMIFAAFGYLKPIEGAIVQEAIDVAVILNALRALGSGISARKVRQN